MLLRRNNCAKDQTDFVEETGLNSWDHVLYQGLSGSQLWNILKDITRNSHGLGVDKWLSS